MFNSKSKTYLLLVAVLGIWGTVAYKIINGLSPDDPEVKSQSFTTAFKPKPIAKSERFDIQPTERDPFLGTLTKKRTVSNTPKTINNTPKPQRQVKITYSGFIKNQSTSKPVFVLNINKKQHLMKIGQTVDSVTLVRGNQKSIMVRYQNKLETLSRN